MRYQARQVHLWPPIMGGDANSQRVPLPPSPGIEAATEEHYPPNLLSSPPIIPIRERTTGIWSGAHHQILAFLYIWQPLKPPFYPTNKQLGLKKNCCRQNEDMALHCWKMKKLWKSILRFIYIPHPDQGVTAKICLKCLEAEFRGIKLEVAFTKNISKVKASGGSDERNSND